MVLSAMVVIVVAVWQWNGSFCELEVLVVSFTKMDIIWEIGLISSHFIFPIQLFYTI